MRNGEPEALLRPPRGQNTTSKAESQELKGNKKMKVTTYIINKGQPTQYYGLKNATDNTVLYDAPNNWKTEKGAIRWAINHGLVVSK